MSEIVEPERIAGSLFDASNADLEFLDRIADTVLLVNEVPLDSEPLTFRFLTGTGLSPL